LGEYCKEWGQLAEDSEVGLGSKLAVVSMMMMMMIGFIIIIYQDAWSPERQIVKQLATQTAYYNATFSCVYATTVAVEKQ